MWITPKMISAAETVPSTDNEVATATGQVGRWCWLTRSTECDVCSEDNLECAAYEPRAPNPLVKKRSWKLRESLDAAAEVIVNKKTRSLSDDPVSVSQFANSGPPISLATPTRNWLVGHQPVSISDSSSHCIADAQLGECKDDKDRGREAHSHVNAIQFKHVTYYF